MNQAFSATLTTRLSHSSMRHAKMDQIQTVILKKWGILNSCQTNTALTFYHLIVRAQDHIA